MTKHNVVAAIIAAASLVASAASSRAEPPPPMWVGAIEVPVVVCDTKEEALAIATAARDSTQAMLAKYQELATTKDDKGDSTCASSPISQLMVNEREDFGLAHAANGDLMHLWIVHGGTHQGDFWFIYAQNDPQTNA